MTLTDSHDLLHGWTVPAVAWHLAVVGSQEALLLNQPQSGENIGYVVQPADLGWRGGGGEGRREGGGGREGRE